MGSLHDNFKLRFCNEGVINYIIENNLQEQFC